MQSFRDSMRGKILLPWFLVLVLGAPALRPPSALAQQNDPIMSFRAFNTAALNGDLDTVQQLLSRRFLHSTSFVEERQRDPSRLKEEVRLLSFYQVLEQEPLTDSAIRVKVLQQRLVGRQGLVTRWYYLVREDGLWKVDRIGEEEPYQ